MVAPGSSRHTGESGGRAARLDALHADLADRVAAMTVDGTAWRDWLDFAARFRGYSFHNVLLLALQRPDATGPFAGYRQWQAAGRQVRRGEAGLTILAPLTRRTTTTPHDPGTGTGGVFGAAAGPRSGGADPDAGDPTGPDPAGRRVVGFKPVTVFAIDQTDGPAIPAAPVPVLLAGQAPPGLWEALAAQVTTAGFTITRGDCGDANGLTDWTTRQVRVRDDVTDAQAVKTLAHELGHVLLHHPDPGSPSTRACRGILEVEAESLAHLVLAARGMDTSAYTHDYVTGWAASIPGTDPAHVVRQTADRVIRAATLILDRCDTATLADPQPTDAPIAVGPASRPSFADTPVTTDTSTGVPVGTRVPVTTNPRTDEPVDPARLQALLTQASHWYAGNAAPSWVPTYLTGRGLSAAMQAPFHAGYAPPRWTTTGDAMRRLGFTDTELLASGIGLRARTGRVIDRFRDRLMLPVRGPDGDVVGFVGRARPTTDAAATPRYLNTPTTTLYRKQQALFGLWENQTLLRDGARPVLVEGPLDAVAVTAHTNGAAVGIAACGTAWTADHITTITDQARVPALVMFDGDTAGRAAAAHLAAADHPALTHAHWVPTPDGGDPADLPRPVLQRLVTEPRLWRPLPAAEIDHALAGITVNDTIVVRVAAARAIAPALLRHGDPNTVVRACAAVANRLDLDPATIRHVLIEAMPLTRAQPDPAPPRIDPDSRLGRGTPRAPCAITAALISMDSSLDQSSGACESHPRGRHGPLPT